MKLPSLSAFFPAFNEEENLPRLVEEFYPVLGATAEEFELLIVDDGSRDGTARVARELSARFPAVRLLSHETNRGYGAAVRTGLAAARMEYVFYADADLQFDPADLPRLARAIEGHDIAIGYRADRQDPLARRAAGRAWNVLVRLALGVSVRDVDCAFKLFRRQALERAGAGSLTSDGVFVSAELLHRLLASGARVRQIPVRHRPRVAGTPSSVTPRSTVLALRDLWRYRRALASGPGRQP